MKAFSLIELILILSILAILSYITFPKTKQNELDLITSKIILYLKQTRYQALIDNKYDPNDERWHKQRWSMKFFNCKKSLGGVYYSIYSNKNNSGIPSANDALKDPLTKKNIYSSNSCNENSSNSKYVLLTKNFHIEKINLSCNSTNSLGQIAFGADGRIFSRLSSKINEDNKYEIKKPCTLRLTHKNGDYKEIVVEPTTGYIYEKQ